MSRKGVVTLVPKGNFAYRSEVVDADRDGSVEYSYDTSVSYGLCGGAWCCAMNTEGPRVQRYIGWDGSSWREDLVRLRSLYQTQLEAANKDIDSLRLLARSDRNLRCRLGTEGTVLFWLGQLLGEDREPLTRQWKKDMALFTPADCYPATSSDGPELSSVVASRDTVLAEIAAMKLPRLFTRQESAAASGKKMNAAAGAGAIDVAAPVSNFAHVPPPRALEPAAIDDKQ